MQTDLFRYALREYNTFATAYEYYYIDNAGVLQTSFTPTFLQYAPQGWEDQSLKYERGNTYYGVFTNYTNPLRFVKDGRKILKDLYYNNGINQNLELLIEKHTNLVSSWGYQTYFVGDIDFSRFKDMKDFTQVEIMEQGFMAKLKANEDTNFEIPIETNLDAVWVKLDGYPLQGTSEWASAKDSECLGLYSRYYPILAQYFLDGYNKNLYLNTQMVLYTNTPGNELYLLENIEDDQSVDFVYEYSVDVYNGTTGFSGPLYFGITVSLIAPNGSQTETNLYIHPTTQATGTSVLYTGTLTWNMNVLSGYRVNIRYYGWATPGSTFYPTVAWKATEAVKGSKLTATWLTKVPETYVPCLTPTKVLENIATNIDPTANVNLQDVPAQYHLTSGDALRNLNGSLLKTNFTDFFRACNAMSNLAFYFDKSNNEANFCGKDVVFNEVVPPYNIGEVASVQVEPYISEMYATTKFGYKRYDYDTINGKEEFNIDYTWKTPLTRVQNTRDLISPYRADMYGIELIRANLSGKKNADSDNDNDVFWLDVDISTVAGTIPAGYQGAGEDYYDLFRDTGLTITGLIAPNDAYNINFSPKRRMFAHGNHIVSSLTPYTAANLTYTNSSKTQDNNVHLETDDGTTIINEQQNEQIGNLGTQPYFMPYMFTIEVKIPVNLQSIFDNGAQRFGTVEFTYKGTTYEGYIIEATDSPTYRPKQTFKLLAKAGTNLTDLINGL